jgi:hypothetical protein
LSSLEVYINGATQYMLFFFLVKVMVKFFRKGIHSQ